MRSTPAAKARRRHWPLPAPRLGHLTGQCIMGIRALSRERCGALATRFSKLVKRVIACGTNVGNQRRHRRIDVLMPLSIRNSWGGLAGDGAGISDRWHE
jgi:hypothetical protein